MNYLAAVDKAGKIKCTLEYISSIYIDERTLFEGTGVVSRQPISFDEWTSLTLT